MKITDGQTIESTTLEIDDTHFRRCLIRNCKIIYRGGLVSWEDTTFADCQITVADAANNTVEVLTGFGFRITPPKGHTLSAPHNY